MNKAIKMTARKWWNKKKKKKKKEKGRRKKGAENVANKRYLFVG